MNKRYYSIFLLKVLMCVIVTVLFTVTWYVFYSQSMIFPFYRKGNWLIVALYLFLYYIVGNQMSAFSVGNTSAGSLAFSQIATIAVVNIFTFFEISLIGRYWVDGGGLWLLTAVEVLLSVIWSVAVTRFYFRLYPPMQMTVLYSEKRDEAAIRKFEASPKSFVIKEYVDVETEPDLRAKISESGGVILSGMRDRRLQEALKMCYSLGKRTYIYPGVSEIIVNGAEKLTIYDMPVFMCNSAGLTEGQLFIKRLVDILLSAVGVAISSPVMAVVAVMIKSQDGGPVIFKQKRLTRDGREFMLYKFRTMGVDAEADGVARLSSKNDSRVTPLGKKLRRTRLDELPQLVNILKGDISLVGPRPERPELVEKYKKTLPAFDFRLKVKAGLTGYAQVMGKYSTTPRNKLLMDLIYIENFSFWLDVKIFLLTIKAVFTPSSTD